MDLTCVFCKGMHKPNLCTRISCPKKHLAIIKNAGLCFNCLGRHKVSQCPLRFECKKCHKKHYTSLCQAFTTNIEPSLQTKPDRTVSTAAPTTTATAHNKETPTTVTTTSLSAFPMSVCLLKTAIANVSTGKTTVEGHILFDEGAQRSFITQELTNQLKLQPFKYENVSVSSFSEQVSASRKLVVSFIYIHTLNGDHVSVSVLIVPKIAAPIHNSVRAHVNELSYLQGLQLAYPVTSDENFHISILTGADFYWNFIQDHVVCGDGPTAVESRLGYLLSGPMPLSQSIYMTCSQVLTLSCTTEDVDHSSFWMIESMGTTSVN